MVIEPTPVQFVGGHSDGLVMVVDCLKPEMCFRVADKFQYGEWFKTHKEIYILLPDTTIYVFKRLE